MSRQSPFRGDEVGHAPILVIPWGIPGVKDIMACPVRYIWKQKKKKGKQGKLSGETYLIFHGADRKPQFYHRHHMGPHNTLKLRHNISKVYSPHRNHRFRPGIGSAQRNDSLSLD